MKASEIVEQALKHMRDRAATYDRPDGERSIGATVEAFNAITGDGLMNTEERGWLFMILLKAVRSQQGDYRADSYEDGAAYFALAGEAAFKERVILNRPVPVLDGNSADASDNPIQYRSEAEFIDHLAKKN